MTVKISVFAILRRLLLVLSVRVHVSLLALPGLRETAIVTTAGGVAVAVPTNSNDSSSIMWQSQHSEKERVTKQGLVRYANEIDSGSASELDTRGLPRRVANMHTSILN